MPNLSLRDIQNSERLGSQMSNFAMLYYIGKHTGHNVSIHKSNQAGRFPQTDILDIFDTPIHFYDEPYDMQDISRDKNDYVKYFLLPSDKNIMFRGFFNHGTFFWSKIIEDIAKNFFTFKAEIKQKAKEIILSIRSQKQLVGVHFRRGDYCMQGTSLPNEYYKKALQYFSQNFTFVIFSDDIHFCKNNKEEIFGKKDVIFIENETPGVDMCLMSMCDHNIIANSTFSIWGAALNNNKNKTVVSVEMTPGGDKILDCFSSWKVV